VRLLQFPGVAVAVLAAALVLALTATSGRLFLAAAGDAAVAQELERVGGVPALALVAFGGDSAAAAAVQAEAESVARFDAPELGPPVRTRLGPALDVVAGARATGVRFAARDGFEAHVEVLDRVAGGGAWLTHEVARSLGARAGQTVRLGGPDGVEVEVAGVYRDLAAGDRPLDPFWSPLASSIYDLSVARNPPPLLLVDPDRFDDLAARLGEPARQEWDFYPEPGRLTLARADRLAAQVRVVESAAGDPLQTWGSTGSPPARRSPPSWAAPAPPWPP
jgi:hypothetical protein